MRLRALLVIAVSAGLSACSSLSTTSWGELTKSGLVGTWAVKIDCGKGSSTSQQTVFSFKQSSVPLVAEGFTYSYFYNTGSFAIAQAKGENSLTHSFVKEWRIAYSSDGTHYIAEYNGKKAAAGLDGKEFALTYNGPSCTKDAVAIKVSDEYVEELRPAKVKDFILSYFPAQPSSSPR